MKLINNIGLIGDFLGTIPVMIHLARENPEGLQVANVHPEIKELFTMIPKEYKITEALSKEGADAELNLLEAFRISSIKDLHMTQAHFATLGLPVPDKPIRPELEFDYDPEKRTGLSGDFMIAPFSRSLPDDQKWPSHYWQEVIDKMHDKSFAILGNTKHDDFNFISGNNVIKNFGYSFNFVSRIIKKSGKLISLVNGMSHLSYALGVETYLISGQTGKWGLNPEALFIPITKLEPDQLIEILKTK